MREFRLVAAYFAALLGLMAAGYAAAGLTTGPLHSLVSSIAAPQAVPLPAEGVEPALVPDASRAPVWMAPTPAYSYAPPSGAARARQSAKSEGQRDGRRDRRGQRPETMTSQSRRPPGRITIAPVERQIMMPFERPDVPR